ncbi:MAG: hypothetical protein DRH50_11810, partial [Deltaproteobacteria bacterium]
GNQFMLLYRPGAVLSLRSVMLEFEAVYTGLPVCSLCLFFETPKLIQRFNDRSKEFLLGQRPV